MQQMRKIEISPKTLLSEKDFKKYKSNNIKWFVIHSILLISIFAIISVSIINKELDLGIYTGSLVFGYLISLGVLASKNKLNWFLWVVLTFISMFTLPIIGILVSHALITRKGFKNEWLSTL